MSAICGLISMSGAPVSVEKGREMMAKLEKYPVDYSEIYCGEHYFFGCHHKVVTPESKYESLPYRDSSCGLSLTADATIYNRSELLKTFNVSAGEWSKVTDSQLILLAYKKWGDQCPVHIVGDYAFAIYDEHKKELFCARDHIGKKTFYFYHTPDRFAFCTIMEPLFCAVESPKVLNESWIVNFLSFGGPLHEVDPNQTIYKDVMQLLPANSLKVTLSGVKVEQYWSPLDRPVLKLKSDTEYEEAFREVFFDAVKCRLRTNGTIGVMMSGGLDSGSVACVAAQQLEERGERLQAFCSIPISGYNGKLPLGRIADETSYIEAIKESVKNLDVTYVQSENKSSVTDIDYLLSLLEHPYKTVENLFWTDNITALAAEKGCTALLNGQLGNMSISFGSMEIHLVTLLKQFRLLSLAGEIREYSRLIDQRTSKVAKAFIKLILPENLPVIGRAKRIPDDSTLPVPINPELAVKYNTFEQLRNLGIIGSETSYDLRQVRENISNPRYFSQIGAIDSKLSLNYGIETRDPSADKRVIDFCFSLPEDQYVRHGQDRRLIRKSMQGILPDKVRLNYMQRGLQSADWVQRLRPQWGDVRREIEEMLGWEEFQHYISVPQIRRALDEVGEIPEDKQSWDVRMIVVSLVFGKFLKAYRGQLLQV